IGKDPFFELDMLNRSRILSIYVL
ncbi:unnamed protein product, partial [Cuscuta campestris]